MASAKTIEIVLDTSIFVSPDSRRFFGKTPKEALLCFLENLKTTKNISCYMPPSVFDELSKFIDAMPCAKSMILINKKPPSSYQSMIPALFVYELIEETRLRTNKGLRIAEKYTRKKNKDENNLTQNKSGCDEELIKTLRHEYRVATREGVIDSKQDFDLILLSKELNAFLATTDKGLIFWAEKIGIRCLNPEELQAMLNK